MEKRKKKVHNTLKEVDVSQANIHKSHTHTHPIPVEISAKKKKKKKKQINNTLTNHEEEPALLQELRSDEGAVHFFFLPTSYFLPFAVQWLG